MPISSYLRARRWPAALALCLATSLTSQAALAQATEPGPARQDATTATHAADTPSPVSATPTPAAQPDSAAVAESPDLDSVRTTFESRFPDTEVAAVRSAGYPGLYEIQVGVELLYTDASVSYLLHGTLVDAATRIDRTAERQLLLAKDAFTRLPMQWAITQTKGDGSRQMAVFEDPNCGYCKQLHRTLAQMDNITIHTFLYPILSPDSTVKARNIWCAKDRVAAWTDWMLNNKVPAAATCETPLEPLAEVARSLMVRGTPAIFLPDGTRFNGAAPLQTLNEALARQQPAPANGASTNAAQPAQPGNTPS